jgi:hypothetical protein
MDSKESWPSVSIAGTSQGSARTRGQKMRVNQGQEFVIGGYTLAGQNFDAIIFGYHDDRDRLVYVARTRNGFTPASRDVPRTGDGEVPFREPAGSAERALGDKD